MTIWTFLQDVFWFVHRNVVHKETVEFY